MNPLRGPKAAGASLFVALAVATGVGAQPDSLTMLKAQAIERYAKGSRADLDAAIPMLRRAASLAQASNRRSDAAELLGYLANARNSIGQVDSAMQAYREAISAVGPTGDPKLRATLITLLGQAFQGLGAYDSAVTQYQQAIPLATAANDSSALGRIFNNIGIAAQATGQLDTAATYLGRALTIRRAVRDRLGEGVTLNNLASLEQRLGRPDSALVLLRSSLSARREVKDHVGEANTLNSLGYAFELSHKLDSALLYYRASRAAEEPLGRLSLRAITRANMGRVFLGMALADSALIYLREGLALKRQVGDHAGAAWALNDLGRVHRDVGRSDSALYYFGEALTALRGVKDRQREGETLYNLGLTHVARGRPGLATAVAYFDSSARLRAAVGRSAAGDVGRLSFAEQDVQLHEQWTLAWLGGPAGTSGSDAIFAAIAAADHGRAGALLDLMRVNTGNAAPHGGTESMAQAGRRLTRSVVSADGGVLLYVVTRDTLVAIHVNGAGLPQAFKVNVSRDRLEQTVRDFRRQLGVHEGTIVRGLESDSRGAVAASASSGSSAAATRLARLLVPPALRERLRGTRELLIIPHGPTALVPFAALSPGDPARPLGATLAIRYSPSLASAFEAQSRTSSVAPLAKSVVVGNPVMPLTGRQTLPPLKGAELEATAVAKRLGAIAWSGSAATESRVRTEWSLAPIIHLATHGFAYSSEADARRSFVALAPGNGNDGVLSVGELLDDATARLSADLVVLSACQTGLGNLRQAEGTVGLQRAFLAKGARSVLVSLWNVSDDATRMLMDRFYAHWLDDRDKPNKVESLRRAQADVKKKAEFSAPRFWAAFQVVGAR